MSATILGGLLELLCRRIRYPFAADEFDRKRSDEVDNLTLIGRLREAHVRVSRSDKAEAFASASRVGTARERSLLPDSAGQNFLPKR